MDSSFIEISFFLSSYAGFLRDFCPTFFSTLRTLSKSSTFSRLNLTRITIITNNNRKSTFPAPYQQVLRTLTSINEP